MPSPLRFSSLSFESLRTSKGQHWLRNTITVNLHHGWQWPHNSPWERREGKKWVLELKKRPNEWVYFPNNQVVISTLAIDRGVILSVSRECFDVSKNCGFEDGQSWIYLLELDMVQFEVVCLWLVSISVIQSLRVLFFGAQSIVCSWNEVLK